MLQFVKVVFNRFQLLLRFHHVVADTTVFHVKDRVQQRHVEAVVIIVL